MRRKWRGGQDWWLDPIPLDFRERAVEAAEAGNVFQFMHSVDDPFRVRLLFRNIAPLQRIGKYESALLDVFTWTGTLNQHWQPWVTRMLFGLADRKLLRAAGDALPGHGPFTVYRGVSGRGSARRVRGWSWTTDLMMAKWFATRFQFPNPSVFTATVRADQIFAYIPCEDEFIVDPQTIRPKRLLNAEDLKLAAGKIAAWREQQRLEDEERRKKDSAEFQRKNAHKIAAMREKMRDKMRKVGA